LEGHGDERGTREYNMALGERRGIAVRDFLSLQGVDSALIEVISFGDERPTSRGSSESDYSMNRRVELK
jgi:peptidoglycan-associated lipoprotein